MNILNRIYKMQEIDIQTFGINLNEPMRKHILERLHSVFGYEKNKVNKIIIKLYDQSDINHATNMTCYIKIYIDDKSPIITKLESLDIFSAITLAIERARIKLDKSINNTHQEKARIQINEKKIRYGSYRIYQ